MAKVSFNNLDEVEQANQGGAGSDIGFFTLRNDNDEAIVRFMCDSVDDFDIQTVHDVQVGGKYRKVNCIRDMREPLDNCPLCKSGARINNRFFIRMIEYKKSQDSATGQITVTPCPVIWERSTQYAKTLKSYLDNYGPLSDIICKIIRHGKAGDMQTTYEIVPNLSKMVYKDEIYVKDPMIFGDYNTFGTIVMDKSFEDMTTFLATGEFPAKPNANAQAAPPQVVPHTTYSAPVAAPQPVGGPMYAPPMNTAPATPVPNVAPVPQDAYTTTGMPPVQAPVATTGGTRLPWEAPAEGAAVSRPVRRY